MRKPSREVVPHGGIGNQNAAKPKTRQLLEALNMHCHVEEKYAWKCAAEVAGQSLSAWVRSTLNNKSGYQPHDIWK